VYVNFLSDEGTAGVQAAYGKRLACLIALKDRHDPDNVFRLNANIPPSVAPTVRARPGSRRRTGIEPA
jgi:Berberine and berberine like